MGPLITISSLSESQSLMAKTKINDNIYVFLAQHCTALAYFALCLQWILHELLDVFFITREFPKF